ncbi:hypothetical protein LX99_02210 [Mucilaginibacter oryzae]|uniref:Uncharacterized protein n=1 Tax=Mucilaginibacter oryzae TaxID=468058 RepID=A0A316HCW1_9SPHI|nr:hypothetical protein LX99_02210 [Mucilaginibacter oryzae]
MYRSNTNKRHLLNIKSKGGKGLWGLASEDLNLHHGFHRNALPMVCCEVSLTYGILIFFRRVKTLRVF